MTFEKTDLSGVYIVHPDPVADERGFFARTYCEREFQAQGLVAHFVQCSISFNRLRGTWRGMHYQTAPFEEAKLVRCTRGAIWDVAVDVRPGSSTFGRHVSVELTSGNRTMLYIPQGLAHGFQTLDDESEVSYQISQFYSPVHACGFRWNDSRFDLRLPLPISVISDRDANYPDFLVPGA